MQCIFPAGGGGGGGGAAAGGAEDKKEEKKDEPEEEEEDEVSCNTCSAYSMHLLGSCLWQSGCSSEHTPAGCVRGIAIIGAADVPYGCLPCILCSAWDER